MYAFIYTYKLRKLPQSKFCKVLRQKYSENSIQLGFPGQPLCAEPIAGIPGESRASQHSSFPQRSVI